MNLVDDIYTVTRTFPPEEKFGLSSQIRRCVVSIPSNIAEGSHRSTKKDFRSFLYIAFSSGAELETQIEIMRRQKLASVSEVDNLQARLKEVMGMLHNLIKSIDDSS